MGRGTSTTVAAPSPPLSSICLKDPFPSEVNAFIMYKLLMNYLKIEGYDSKRNQRDPDNMAAGTPSLYNIHGTTTKIIYSKVIGIEIEELADALKNKVFWRPLHVLRVTVLCTITITIPKARRYMAETGPIPGANFNNKAITL